MTTKYIAASKIGSMAYCPHAQYLERNGARVGRETAKARARGIRAHKEDNRQHKPAASHLLKSVFLLLLLAIALFYLVVVL